MKEGSQPFVCVCVCFIDLLPRIFWHWHVWLISKFSYFCHKGNFRPLKKKKKKPASFLLFVWWDYCQHTCCYSIALSKIHLPIILFPSSPSFHFLHNRIHRSRDMSYSVQTMGDSQHPQGRNKGSEANRTFWLSVRERETERESLCVDIYVRNLTGVLWKAKSWLQTTEHTHTHAQTHAQQIPQYPMISSWVTAHYDKHEETGYNEKRCWKRGKDGLGNVCVPLLVCVCV